MPPDPPGAARMAPVSGVVPEGSPTPPQRVTVGAGDTTEVVWTPTWRSAPGDSGSSAIAPRASRPAWPAARLASLTLLALVVAVFAGEYTGLLYEVGINFYIGQELLLVAFAIALVLVIAVEIVLAAGRRRASAPVVTAAAPVFIADRGIPATDVVAQLLAIAGATITSHSPSMVTGTITSRGKANFLVALLLWMLCIVPMVIYIVSASKDVTRPFTARLGS